MNIHQETRAARWIVEQRTVSSPFSSPHHCHHLFLFLLLFPSVALPALYVAFSAPLSSFTSSSFDFFFFFFTQAGRPRRGDTSARYRSEEGSAEHGGRTPTDGRRVAELRRGVERRRRVRLLFGERSGRDWMLDFCVLLDFLMS